MKGLISKVLVTSLLLVATVVAYGACFNGWFLPKPLDKPVSLRDGSKQARTHGYGFYFIGRTHYGGSYGRGK